MAISTPVKVLLIVVVIIVGVGVMAIGAGVFLVSKFHVVETGTGDKKTVTLRTPMGDVAVHENHSLNPENIGIPIYPGAVLSKEQGGMDFQIDSGELHKDYTVSGATYLTPDATDKVEAFYKDKFPSWNQKWENGSLHLETHDDGRIRSIAVKREGDETRIGVASVGAPAGN